MNECLSLRSVTRGVSVGRRWLALSPVTQCKQPFAVETRVPRAAARGGRRRARRKWIRGSRRASRGGSRVGKQRPWCWQVSPGSQGTARRPKYLKVLSRKTAGDSWIIRRRGTSWRIYRCLDANQGRVRSSRAAQRAPRAGSRWIFFHASSAPPTEVPFSSAVCGRRGSKSKRKGKKKKTWTR